MKSVQMRGFFWSAFPCIRTGYGDKLRKSPYSVQIQENTDKKLRIWTLFTQWKINLVWKKNKTKAFLKISLWEISFCLFITKQKQNKKCLLSLNFGMEICKTVSRSIAGNQAQKTPHALHWIYVLVFNPFSIAVSTFSSRSSKNWEV